MGQKTITKEKMWYYLQDPHTSKREAFTLLDDFAEYMFEKGWAGHKKVQRGIHNWTAQKMKEAFDHWYDKNISKYPLKDLEEIRAIWYSFIPKTNPPKFNK
jgi:hypothetical protein